MAEGKVWTREKFPAGTMIFRQGDDANRAYLIEQGQIEIFTGHGPSKIVRATLGPNSLFGEIALIDKKARSATAVAVVDTSCLILREFDFDKILDRTDPFLRRLVELLIARVRTSNELDHHH